MKTISEILGGKDMLSGDFETDLDLVLAILHGLPAQSVDKIATRFGLKSSEVDEIINRRTRGRRRDNNEPLTPEESDRLVRVARLFDMAEDTFGSLEKAQHWMRHSNSALGNAKPITFITTDSGARLVEQLLGRLAHGVFS